MGEASGVTRAGVETNVLIGQRCERFVDEQQALWREYFAAYEVLFSQGILGDGLVRAGASVNENLVMCQNRARAEGLEMAEKFNASAAFVEAEAADIEAELRATALADGDSAIPTYRI